MPNNEKGAAPKPKHGAAENYFGMCLNTIAVAKNLRRWGRVILAALFTAAWVVAYVLAAGQVAYIPLAVVSFCVYMALRPTSSRGMEV